MFVRVCERANSRISSDKLTVEKFICLVISLIVGIIFGVKAFQSLDKVPAKFDDYAPLNDILVSIQDNPEYVLHNDGVLTISGDTIKYTVENEQCSLTGVYDKDYKLIERIEKDKGNGFFDILFAMLLVFVGAVILTFLLISVPLYIGIYIYYYIVELIADNRLKKSLLKKSNQSQENDDSEENDDDSAEWDESADEGCGPDEEEKPADEGCSSKENGDSEAEVVANERCEDSVDNDTDSEGAEPTEEDENDPTRFLAPDDARDVKEYFGGRIFDVPKQN